MGMLEQSPYEELKKAKEYVEKAQKEKHGER